MKKSEANSNSSNQIILVLSSGQNSVGTLTTLCLLILAKT